MSPPPSRAQVVLDGTGIVGGSQPYPSYTGFYGTPTWGQPYFQPNGELILELRPVTGLTIAGNFGVGNNYIATQENGWHHGHPFDLPQAFIDYCPGGGIFCMRVGREYDTFGPETVRSDQTDYTIRSTSFTIMPYTRNVASIGFVNDQATWRLGASMGPDNVDFSRLPWAFSYFTYTGTKAGFFTNLQVGPGLANDANHWRVNTDLGITYDPIAAIHLGIYGFFSTENSVTAGWQNTGGGYFYFRGREPGKALGGVLRFGFVHDDGLRAGTLLDLAQLSGGLNIYATDWLQFRVQGDLLAATDGSRPFNGESFLPRATLQVIINPFVEFGRDGHW